MILSVYLPHGAYDEENNVAWLEDIRVIMKEGRALGAKDFLVGGTLILSSNSTPTARTLRFVNTTRPFFLRDYMHTHGSSLGPHSLIPSILHAHCGCVSV